MKKVLSSILISVLLFSVFCINLSLCAGAVWEGQFEFRAVDGYAEIIGVSPEISGDVVIPSYYGGYDVRSIAPDVFKNCTEITSVTFNENIKIISYGAFEGCTKLTTVNFNAKSCLATGSAEKPVFKDCTALTTVNVGAEVEKLPDYMFYGVATLSEINFAGATPKIGKETFFGCPLINIADESASSSENTNASSEIISSYSEIVLSSSDVSTSSSEPTVTETSSIKESSTESTLKESDSSVQSATPLPLPTIDVSDDEDKDGHNLTYLWIIEAAVIILLGVTLFFLFKKQK